MFYVTDSFELSSNKIAILTNTLPQVTITNIGQTTANMLKSKDGITWLPLTTLAPNQTAVVVLDDGYIYVTFKEDTTVYFKSNSSSNMYHPSTNPSSNTVDLSHLVTKDQLDTLLANIVTEEELTRAIANIRLPTPTSTANLSAEQLALLNKALYPLGTPTTLQDILKSHNFFINIFNMFNSGYYDKEVNLPFTGRVIYPTNNRNIVVNKGTVSIQEYWDDETSDYIYPSQDLYRISYQLTSEDNSTSNLYKLNIQPNQFKSLSLVLSQDKNQLPIDINTHKFPSHSEYIPYVYPLITTNYNGGEYDTKVLEDLLADYNAETGMESAIPKFTQLDRYWDRVHIFIRTASIWDTPSIYIIYRDSLRFIQLPSMGMSLDKELYLHVLGTWHDNNSIQFNLTQQRNLT